MVHMFFYISAGSIFSVLYSYIQVNRLVGKVYNIVLNQFGLSSGDSYSYDTPVSRPVPSSSL